jgi:hypothetical protein
VRATWPICQIRRIRGKSLFPASRLPKWDRSPFTRKIRFVFGAHVSVCRDNGCDKRYSLVSVWCLDISFHSSLALWIALASRHYRKFLTIVGSIIFFTGATVLYRSLNQESILVRVFEAARKGTQAALNEFQNKPLPPPALKQPTPQYRDSGSMRSEKGRRISIKC